MKPHFAICQHCEKEFYYPDLRNVPSTCGERICKTNYAYQQKRRDPSTNQTHTKEELKSWRV